MDALSRAIHRFYQSVFRTQNYSALLETPCLLENTANHQLSLVGLNPRRIYRLVGTELTVFTHAEDIVTDIADDPQRLWDVLEHAVQVAEPNNRLFCHLGYEATRWMDSAWHDVTMGDQSSGFPDLLLCEMADWVSWERDDATRPIASDDLSAVPMQIHGHTQHATDALHEVWKEACLSVCENESIPLKNSVNVRLDELMATFSVSQTLDEFSGHVNKVLSAIQAGDVYQANLSLQFSKPTDVSPLTLYQQLVEHNPSPFGGVFQCPQGTIVSNSPERLVDIKPVGDEMRVSCRPIAGTRGRKADMVEDADLAAVLRNDPKERAEHVMLVDLIRNDIGRIALAGSVNVDELMTIERYTHVMHLVSHVSGALSQDKSHDKKGLSPWEVVKATFPGGTITGCPKIRCVQLLNQLEAHRRGPYTGSFGYMNPRDGTLDFNILIRTALFQPSQRLSQKIAQKTAQKKWRASKKEKLGMTVRFCVGAGLVADSVAEYEYKECLRKATSMLTALHVVESAT
jgi:anthranilate/para-aminobenzoate synthase component I